MFVQISMQEGVTCGVQLFVSLQCSQLKGWWNLLLLQAM